MGFRLRVALSVGGTHIAMLAYSIQFVFDY
jgi:hypothetical protein